MKKILFAMVFCLSLFLSSIQPCQSQNVGIGNPNPKAKLDIYGNLKLGNTSSDSASALNGTIRYGVNATEFEGYNGSSWIPLHSLWTRGTGSNIHKPAGTVGINWIDPTGLLGINTSNSSDTNLVLRRSSTGTYLKALDSNFPNSAFVLQLDTNKTGSATTESFARMMVSNSYPNQFTIHENGLIGIGTKKPCALPGLESGLVEFCSNSYTIRSDWVMRVASDPLGCAALLLSKSAGTPDNPTRVNNVNGNNHALGLVSFLGYQVESGFGQFVRSAEITGWVDGDPSLENDLPGRITFHTRPYGFYNMIPPERMRIDRDGKVGIGTTSPGEILDVNGRIAIRNSSTPTTTANKLYAKNGVLYWGNSAVVTSGGGTSPGSITTYASGSGTYTVPANVYMLVVEVIGGGGGGAGGTANSNSKCIAGSGGGGGAYSRKLFLTTPGSTFSYSVGSGGAGTSTSAGGNGGNSTFSTLTANGGSGGSDMASGSTTFSVDGGAGGNASGGDINVDGSSGGNGYRMSANLGLSGSGGGCVLAPVNPGVNVPASQSAVNGHSATGYGGGGAGGAAYRTSTTYTATGGDGSPGIIIITEYK